MDQFDFQSGRETRVGWGGDKNLTMQLGLNILVLNIYWY